MDKDLVFLLSRADRQLDAPTAEEAAHIVELGSFEAEASFGEEPLTNGDKVHAVRPRVYRVDTISFDDSTINGVDGGAAASVLTIVGSRATVILTAGVEFDPDATITEVVQAVDVAAGAADAGFDASLNGNAIVITHEADGNGVASPTFTDTAVTTIEATTDGEDPILMFPTPGELTKVGLEAAVANTSQALVNTANSATNTVLTADSLGLRCTGTGDQTYTMPVAATVPFIGWGLPFENHSTGNVTIQSSGGNTIQVLAPGSFAFIKCILLSGTDAASWQADYADPGDYTTTATAAGTTELVVSSTRQQYFTGAMTQTCVLPVVSTLRLGMGYRITNLSSGTVTVNSSGGNLVYSLTAGQTIDVVCIAITGTDAASWNVIVIEGDTTVADSTARLALIGYARGARVYQADNSFWYELTNPAAPSDAASWQAIPKRYKALLAQSGTDAPTATVVENSLGSTGTWSRVNPGDYAVTFAAGTFSARMPMVKFSSIVQNDLTALAYIYADSNALPDGINVYAGLYQLNEDPALVGAHLDGMFDNQWIEIEAYP